MGDGGGGVAGGSREGQCHMEGSGCGESYCGDNGDGADVPVDTVVEKERGSGENVGAEVGDVEVE